MIILVRHGLTHFNKHKRFQGQLSVPLSEEGKEQVARAATLIENYLAEQKVAQEHVSFLSSDSLRCIQSSQILLEKLKNVQTPNYKVYLREFDSGIFSNHTAAELKDHANWQPYLDSFDLNPFETRWPGAYGESKQMVLLRLQEFFLAARKFEENAQKDSEKKAMLICTHGGVVQVILENFKISAPNKPMFVGNADVCILSGFLSKEKTSVENFAWNLIRHYKVGESVRASAT